MTRFFDGPRPRRFGHRGARGTHPENTHVSFVAAIEADAHAFELDVHRTADGEIIVLHDDTLERTTDGAGEARCMTLVDLRRFDAGYRFTPDSGASYPFRGQGITIPTLWEVVEAFPETPLIIEIKQIDPPMEPDLAQLLLETGAADRALVFSLAQEPVSRYRALGLSHATGFGPDEVADFLRRLGSGAWEGYRPPGKAFAVPVHWHGTQIVSAPFVEAAHREGCEVYVWTVNEPREMHALLDLGVDGLISDFPARLSRVDEERSAGP